MFTFAKRHPRSNNSQVESGNTEVLSSVSKRQKLLLPKISLIKKLKKSDARFGSHAKPLELTLSKYGILTVILYTYCLLPCVVKVYESRAKCNQLELERVLKIVKRKLQTAYAY